MNDTSRIQALKALVKALPVGIGSGVAATLQRANLAPLRPIVVKPLLR